MENNTRPVYEYNINMDIMKQSSINRGQENYKRSEKIKSNFFIKIYYLL